MSATKTHLPLAILEEQLVDALRPTLPANWQFYCLNCELSGDPTHPQVSFANVCLTLGDDGEWGAQNLAAPPSLLAQFVALREAAFQLLRTRWSSAELRLEGDGSFQITYDNAPPRRLNGISDEQATGRFEAAAFLARFLVAQREPAPTNDGGYDSYDEPPVANRPAAPVPAALPTWACTWCHAEYTSAQQPTSFQPGKCPRNPGKAHAWHR